jgi:KDO2-lipid IV(A) lauroyltransferase
VSDPNLKSPRYWPSRVAVALVHGLGHLPFPLLWALGQAIGRLSYYLARTRRRVGETNLEICFPELSTQERARLLRNHFGWLGVGALTQGHFLIATREQLQRLIRLTGREHIDGPMAAGQPVICLYPHFVGLNLGGMGFGALVHPGVFMYQRLRDPVVDAEVLRARTRFGSVPVERQDDLRTLVRVIKSGAPFLYLPDQNSGRSQGVFVPFCGVLASTVPMLGRFARLTGAKVIPVYARFLPWGQGLELIFDPPLDPFPSKDAVADTAQMNRVIEARMRTMPEQYFWVHRRFRTRPLGEPPIYAPRRRRR